MSTRPTNCLSSGRWNCWRCRLNWYRRRSNGWGGAGGPPLSSALPPRLSDVPPAFVTLNAELSPEQHEAIRTALSHPVSVLTGGPGTGKTTALKALIDVLETAHKRYALASPTGRAAKRLAEATGHPASTIHRLLEYSPVDGFQHNEGNPLDI